MITAKATKSEILAEYKILERENERLTKQLEQFTTASKTGKKADEADITSVANALQDLQGQLGNAVGWYQNAVANELSQIKELEEALSVEISDLQTLHGIDFTPGQTLGQLILKYEEQVEANQEEHNAVLQTIENDVMARDAAWETECQEHEIEVQQSAEDWTLARQRDEEQYKYTRLRSEAQQKDEDQQIEKDFEISLMTMRGEFEKRWQEQSAALAAREEACRNLAEEAAALALKLEKAVKSATAEGEAIARRNASIAARNASAEHNSVSQQKDIELRAVDADAERNDREIARLQSVLNKINSDNQALSASALNSASSGARQAAEVAERIALEHARSSSGKR